MFTSCECVDILIVNNYNYIVNTSLTNNGTCSIFGHSKIEISDTEIKKLKSFFIFLIKHKYINTFYFGGFGEFDDLCYKIVSEIKQIYPTIKRIFCCVNKNWLDPYKRPNWLKNEEYEDIIYLNLNFDWWYKRIYFRNCEIINQSDYIIFYVKNKSSKSGAYKALQYAIIKKKQIFNLAEI